MSKKDKEDKAEKHDHSKREGKKGKLDRKFYEETLFDLHAELVKLQEWVVASGERVIVVFEGRDAAGKGGVIKRITERVQNPLKRRGSTSYRILK